jgi:hypothetical protein
MATYMRFFHGRATPDEELDDWGVNGPIIGPLQWVHTTYGATIRLAFEGSHDQDIEFLLHGDVIYVRDEMNEHFNLAQGREADALPYYYGDWSVFNHTCTSQCGPHTCELKGGVQIDKADFDEGRPHPL